MNTTTPHYGYRIAWFRRLRGWTQQDLGERAGGMKQQEISAIEEKSELSDEVLLKLIKPLGISLELVKDMDERMLGGTVFNSHDNARGNGNFNTNNFNPIGKIIEFVEDNKNLYERILESEKEKSAMQQEVIETLKKLLDRF